MSESELPAEQVAKTSTVINGVRIDGTGFLEAISVALSPGLNCIIGARGTGKTSLLELIRYAVGREPSDPTKAASYADLIRAALGKSGSVEIDVTRSSGERMTIWRSVNSSQHRVTERGSQDLLDVEWPPFSRYEIALFSQDELEDVAVDPHARREVLDSFCGREIDGLRDEISETMRRLEANASRQIELRNETEALKAQSEQLPRLRLELEAAERSYQEILAGVQAQEGERQAFDSLSRRRQVLTVEQDILGRLLRQASDALNEPFPGQVLGQRLGTALSEEALANLVSKDRLRHLRADLSEAAAAYRSLRQQMSDQLHTIRNLIAKGHDDTGDERKAVDGEYQIKAAQLGAMTQRWKEVSSARDTLLAEVRKLELVTERIAEQDLTSEQLTAERRALIERLVQSRARRFGVRQKAATELNVKIGGSVRLNVEESGDLDRYRQFLLDSLKGSAMWYGRLVTPLSERVPPLTLADYARRADGEGLSRVSGLDGERARKVLSALEEPYLNSRLETLDVEDSVTFELRVSDGRYLPSDQLSQGQRCTTILSILLVDSPNPLVIDQPEDNLDNSYIFESVVNLIERQSPNRQFIFVTHNPNIAVLGGAETVIAMESKNGRGAVGALGAWNVPGVKSRILTIMEGGREAFARRQAAYQTPEEELAQHAG